VRAIVAKELSVDLAKLDDHRKLEDLGVDSILLVGIVVKLEAVTSCKIDPSAVIQCESIDGLVRYLVESGVDMPASTLSSAPSGPSAPSAAFVEAPPRPLAREPFRVAVVGIACTFPGARDKEAFFANLVGEVDSISEMPLARQARSNGSPRRFGGFIDGIESVDPTLFGLSESEAADVDPLIRLFTECSLDCLLDAGQDAAAVRGKRVGIFAGARAAGYAERIGRPHRHSVTAIGQNFVASFVSHILDLRGPSMVIDCACSSSLAAVHLACQSLEGGDSELAIAGGVEVLLDDRPYQFLEAAHALSPDGRCRTFDERANGFVPGEGVGCVLLKPLAAALAAGDPIYAVIDGSAVNNDGHTLGATTPGNEGQSEVIERALEKARLGPGDISYVEAHGTGTMIGDPIELRSMARAFSREVLPAGSCAVGSVKTNIGHLLSAAGIASFIKVALSLHHAVLPASLHCERINPRFDFDKTPFLPITQTRPWQSDGPRARRAGVSAFGFGKTNVHLVMCERPAAAVKPADRAASPRFIAAERKVRAWHAPEAPTPAVPPTFPEAADQPLLALEAFEVEPTSVEAAE
jgi:acyl transferase domain-containing protein/acyl carrier protein